MEQGVLPTFRMFRVLKNHIYVVLKENFHFQPLLLLYRILSYIPSYISMGVLLPDFPDVSSSYGAQERKGLIPVLLVIPLALRSVQSVNVHFFSELCKCALFAVFCINVHCLQCSV